MVWGLVVAGVLSVTTSLLSSSDNSGNGSDSGLTAPIVPDSSLNATLPNVFGVYRVGARQFYTTPPRRVSGQSSGKGGQPTATRDTFVVDAMAYAFTFGNEVDIEELYINGRLVYNPNSGDSTIVSDSVNFFNDHMTWFKGTAGVGGQNPSTKLEEFSGVGNVPRFRGMSYLVLRNLDLGDYGNSFPQVVATVRSTTDFQNAKGFLEAAIEFSGINKDSQESFGIDVLTVDESVAQYPFEGTVFQNSGSNVQSWIEPFIELYQLVIFEDLPGQYRLAVPYDVNAATQNVVQIDALESLGVDGGDRYTLNNASKDSTPNSVSLTYQDPLREYDENSITVYNTKTFESNDVTVSLPYVLSRNQSYSGAERLLRAAWSKKKLITFKLPLNADTFLGLGQLVRFNNDPTIQGINWVVSEKVFSTDHFIEYTCYQMNRMMYAYNKNFLGTRIERDNSSGTSNLQQSLNAIVVDAPLILRSDNQRDGVYVAFETPGNSTAVDLWVSCDAGATYEKKGTVNNQTITGKLIDQSNVFNVQPAILDTDYDVVDESQTIQVQLNDTSKALVSVTQAQFDQNAQILYTGGEYISYKDATPLGNGIFELSTLRRGVSNTEYAVSSHPGNQDFAILAGDLSNRPRVTFTDVPGGGTKLFKVLVVGNNDLDSAITQTVNFNRASSLSPAPVEHQPSLSNNDDWTFSWTPRSIGDSARYLRNGIPIPASEDGDVFEVEIFNNATFVKSVFVNGNEYVWADIEQIADTGALVTNPSFNVYQHRQSLPVGRGFQSLNTYEN